MIVCAICGVVQSPETIEGCWANAKKAGAEALLIKSMVPFPPGATGDYAHVWFKQRGDVVKAPLTILTHDDIAKRWAPNNWEALAAQIRKLIAPLGSMDTCYCGCTAHQERARAEKAEAEMAAYRTREKDDFYNAPAQRDEWRRRAEAAQDAIDRLGDFLGLASHDLESAYRSMRSDLIRCFVKAKAAR